MNSGAVGWGFSLSRTIKVTHLGFFDDKNDGQGVAHQAAFFRLETKTIADGSSLTIPAGTSGELVNGFRYTALSRAVVLPPGNYVVAVYIQAGCPDHMLDVFNATPTLGPGLSFQGGRVSTDGRFSFPNTYVGPVDRAGYFGPNFIYKL
jgi:hypothetical protein